MTYDLRLRAYSPGVNTPLGQLPELLSWQVSIVHNGDGALTVKASELAEGGAIISRGLNAGLDIALEANWVGGPNDWVEPDNGLFLLVGDEFDKTDQARVRDLTLPSWSWLLGKVCDLNLGALQGAKSKYAGQRLFPASSDAGDVVKKMLDEHDARPGPPVPIARDSWTTTKDSLGNNWAKKLGKNAEGRAYPAGQPLSEKLAALVRNGLCDWRMRGRGLRIYNPGTGFVNQSGTVRLTYGDDLRDAPSKMSQADRVARLLVRGDGKKKVTTTAPGIPEHYGRWEALLDAAGVKDLDDLEDAGLAELADRNRIKGEYTRTLTMAGPFLPFRDYNVGDWITAPGSSGPEVLRVMQITITRDEQDGLSGNIVLGDRFTTSDLALASKVSAITGGSSGASGNGTVADDEPADTRQPAAPTGLTVTPTLTFATAFGRGSWSAHVDASWDPVTTATDGTAMDIAGYTIWMRRSTEPQSRSVGEPTSSTAKVSGLEPGAEYVFTVSARGATSTEPGQHSAPVTVTIPVDTAPPPNPAAPTLTAFAGGLTLNWTGVTTVGGAMPADFSHVEVELRAAGGSWSVYGRLTGPASLPITPLTYGTTYEARLRAFDISGNSSGYSGVASATPRQVVATDLDTGIVLPGDIAYSDVANLVGDGSFENDVWNGLRAALSKIGSWTVQSADAHHGAKYLQAYSDATPNKHQYLRAEGGSPLVAEFLPQTPQIYLAMRALAPAGTNGTARIGIRLRSAADTFTYVTLPSLAVSPSWTLSEGVATIPAGTKSIAIYLEVQGCTMGRWCFDSVTVREVVPTQLIQDLAVTNAKIHSMSVNKLLAGEISAGEYVRAGSAEGPHSLMDPAGFSAWAPNPDADDAIQKFMRLGDGLIFGFDPTRPNARITSDGHGGFRSVSTDQLMVDGETLDEILDPLPKGAVARTDSFTTATGITTTTPLTERRVQLLPGRLYRVGVNTMPISVTAAGTRAEIKIHQTDDGSPVTTSSPAWIYRTDEITATGVYIHQPPFTNIIDTSGWAEPKEYRFLLSVARAAGTGSIGVYGANCQILVEDLGEAVPSSTTGIRYVSEWLAWSSWTHYSDDESGSYSPGAYFIWHNTGDSQRAYAQLVFSGDAVAGETDKTIAAAVGAASLIKAEVLVPVDDAQLYHSTLDKDYSYSPVLRVHPTPNTASNNTLPGSYTTTPAFSPPQSRWIDVTAQWTTSSRGVYLSLPTPAANRVAVATCLAPSQLRLRLTYFR